MRRRKQGFSRFFPAGCTGFGLIPREGEEVQVFLQCKASLHPVRRLYLRGSREKAPVGCQIVYSSLPCSPRWVPAGNACQPADSVHKSVFALPWGVVGTLCALQNRRFRSLPWGGQKVPAVVNKLFLTRHAHGIDSLRGAG